MENLKQLELAILMNAPKAQIAALKSVLTDKQLSNYQLKIEALKKEFISKNQINDDKLLKLLDEQFV